MCKLLLAQVCLLAMYIFTIIRKCIPVLFPTYNGSLMI